LAVETPHAPIPDVDEAIPGNERSSRPRLGPLRIVLLASLGIVDLGDSSLVGYVRMVDDGLIEDPPWIACIGFG
jgi:hypothetical protein